MDNVLVVRPSVPRLPCIVHHFDPIASRQFPPAECNDRQFPDMAEEDVRTNTHTHTHTHTDTHTHRHTHRQTHRQTHLYGHRHRDSPMQSRRLETQTDKVTQTKRRLVEWTNQKLLL